MVLFFLYIFATGVLNKHLAEVDTRAQTMLNDLIRKFAEQEGANEMSKSKIK
ncbi:MAG: TnpV protein [Oscillospiraceae bacterium]|nr:TnpV protein [Oscillospiraceae bacterium]